MDLIPLLSPIQESLSGNSPKLALTRSSLALFHLSPITLRWMRSCNQQPAG